MKHFILLIGILGFIGIQAQDYYSSIRDMRGSSDFDENEESLDEDQDQDFGKKLYTETAK